MTKYALLHQGSLKSFQSSYSIFSHMRKKILSIVRNFMHDRPSIILGIETSCDDTGCGIVDTTGKILGEAINSQQLTHLK